MVESQFALRDTQIAGRPVAVSQQVPLTPFSEIPEKSVQIDVTKIGKWIDSSVEQMLRFRRDLEVDWQKIRLILNGHHYFDVDSLRGSVVPSIPDDDDDDVRAYTNMMLNAYRRELGTRNSAPIHHLATPKNGSIPDATFMARRAAAALSDWREEKKFGTVFDRFNQLVLRMGAAAFLPEPNWDRSSAVVHTIAGSEIFPLPVTATNTQESSGLVYRKFLAKSWLQQNVDEGVLAPEVLAEVKEHQSTSRYSSSYMSQAIGFGGAASIKGVIGLFYYIHPGPEYPTGGHGLIINAKVWSVHIHPTTGDQSLPIGGAPILIQDTKFDSDWYPQSFLAPLIGLNLEDDRQLSNEIAMAEVNRHGGWTMVPENSIELNDLQQSLGGYIPYQTDMLGFDKRDPFFNIKPPRIGPETAIVSARISREAVETSGHTEAREGNAPGRVDSDAGIQRLLSQSDVPNFPFYERTRDGLAECFNRVLDILAVTWPKEKWIRVVGPLSIPQEMLIAQGDMPTSESVKIEVGALVPTSRQSTLQMLQLLRQNKDISSVQYRSAIVENGLEPKGVQLKDADIEFARAKIAWIYGDGKEPREWPFLDDFELEPHAVCVDQFRLFMNTIPFKQYTDALVKDMMRREIMRHQQKLAGEPGRLRSQFDVEEQDRDRFENRITADEDQPGADNELLSELASNF